MSGALSADARAALEHLQAGFREAAGRFPGLRHVLIEAPDLEAFGELCLSPLDHRFNGRKTRPLLFKEHREIHVFIDDDAARLGAGFDALRPLARAAVKMLDIDGLLQPTEPEPATTGPRADWSDAKVPEYSLRQWMRFIHRHAQDRPGAPPGVESARMAFSQWHAKAPPGTPPDVAFFPEYFESKREVIAHTLLSGVFEASARILSRLLTEGTGQAGPDPPTGPADRPEVEPAAAGPAGSPRGDRQAAGEGASDSKAPVRQAGRQARKVPRGELDERAVARLLRNPTLTRAQLAAALGCSPGTLRDRKKCPKLVAIFAKIRAQRDDFREGSTWRDRRPDDDDA
jgi:hypothetical protein